jgi:hypothetical protein
MVPAVWAELRPPRGSAFSQLGDGLIAGLEGDGHETDTAVSMLRAFEHSLHAFEQHREVILNRLRPPG